MIIAPYITDKRIINKFKGLEEILKAKWIERIAPIVEQAKLKMPDLHTMPIYGGRQKQHTEHFAPMMTEMREVSSTDPNASW